MKKKLYALFLGLSCHSLFALAVSAMAYQVYWGFSRGLLPIGGEIGRVANLFLLIQFPILHSALLSKSGRELLAKLAPYGLGADLATTTFALISSLQILAVFLFWTPSSSVWYVPQGSSWWVYSSLYACAWVFLIRAIHDASTSLHSGFLGWSAVVQGKKPVIGPLPTKGVYTVLRQPIYLAFALILFTGPVWTPDHALFSLVWGLYCFLGPLFKERRFARWYGDSFRDYQRKVPYMLPRPFRSFLS